MALPDSGLTMLGNALASRGASALATRIGLGASALSEDEDKALENEQGGGAVALGRDEQGVARLGIGDDLVDDMGDRAEQRIE